MIPTLYKILALSFVFVLWNCGKKTNDSNALETEKTVLHDDRIKVTKAQFEQAKMTLGSLEEKEFPTLISVNGMIDVPPENRAVVNATMGGYIKTTPLLIGDVVRKGQVLVTLENPEFVTLQQAYMEVNEQLVFLKSEYDRQVTMKAENITSQKSFLRAESEYKTALAKHIGLEKQLSMLHISAANVRAGIISAVAPIYAPISGSITKINISKGSYVSPATEILEIIDTEHIHLELSVFEKDIMKIKKGQQIEFKIPEASSAVYKAEVYLVGTSIQTNRTIKVHGHIENDTNHHFLTGMFVDANIVTDTDLTMALPETAIASVDNENYVLILDETAPEAYYFKQVEIETSQTINGFVSVLDPETIKPNTTFLTQGAFNLVGEGGGHNH